VWSNDGITVLDLGDVREGFVLEEVVRFCFDLDVLDKSRFWRIRKSWYRDLRPRFLHEYGLDGDEWSVDFFTVQWALSLLLTMAEFRKRKRFSQPWHTRAVRYLRGLLATISSR
jgi:hypothetical protein